LASLFRVTANDGFQFLRRVKAVGIIQPWLRNMLVEVIRNDLVEEAIHRSANGCDEVKNFTA